jgi:hypothetical protein
MKSKYVIIVISITIIASKPQIMLYLLPMVKDKAWLIALLVFARDTYVSYRILTKIRIFLSLGMLLISYVAGFIQNPKQEVQNLSTKIKILKKLITGQALAYIKLANFLAKYSNVWVLKKGLSYEKLVLRPCQYNVD